MAVGMWQVTDSAYSRTISITSSDASRKTQTLGCGLIQVCDNHTLPLDHVAGAASLIIVLMPCLIFRPKAVRHTLQLPTSCTHQVALFPDMLLKCMQI